ncbi:MAG: mevalonate kinase [Anaerolineae bacterium]|nr:mevalonate kinase [Anaerolineae bacterium]NIN99311.1 mevalonate kinase [Anaerolineae bacterium]NIQ82176.1 mevalonate kinase [Anaerolineae bacterium]
MTVAYAPGKIILVGEHAVVYGRPAIAVPVTQVQAQVKVEKGEPGQGIVVVAKDLGRVFSLARQERDATVGPLQATVANVLAYLGLTTDHDLTVFVESSIPMARGLGSGAAVSTAMTRAIARHFSRELTAGEISQLVYETEKLHHGTPSGIDNTVIACERPVHFVRGESPETVRVGRSLLLIIADTGVESPTREVVGAVRRAREEARERYDDLFDAVGDIVVEVRRAIERGELRHVGRLLDENHRLLQEMGVSSSRLDDLVHAAKRHGALGAKLSGAGRGGNMIALVTSETREPVKRALRAEGAQGLIDTAVEASKDFATSLESFTAS